MPSLRALLSRLRGLLATRDGDPRLDEEIETHIALLAADYERRGMTTDEARLAARRDFGGVTQIRETCRDTRRFPFFDALSQDLRYALRQLRASPGFTAAAVLTLGLGIGANTAIYRVLDAVMFRSLPVKDPQRLVEIQILDNGKPQHFSYPLFREIASRQRVMDGMFGSSEQPLRNAVLRGRGGLRHVRGAIVTGGYFQVLGVPARQGRVFTEADDRPAATPTAVLSYDFWSREFGRSPEAVGQTLQINNVIATVIGVTPPWFFGETVGSAPDVWLPMSFQPQVMPADWLNAPSAGWLTVIGRMRPGIATRGAESALDALYRHLSHLSVTSEGHQYRLHLEPANRGIAMLRARFENPLWVLMGIAGLVLLIACCNLANLLLGRAAARTHEMGVRLALGAGRARLVRQLLTESLVLAGLGGLLALALAVYGSDALVTLAAKGERWQLPLHVDLRLLGITGACAFLTALLFGLAPAWAATRVDVHSALQARRSQTSGRPRQALGKALVVAQLSISLLLLSAAALLVGSLWNLRHQDFGFQPEGVLTVDLPVEFTPHMMARNAPLREPLYARMNALPGVRSAAVAGFGPTSGWSHTGPISTPDRPARDGDYNRVVHVSPRYFETMGIRMVEGRGIDEGDRAGGIRVAVVSETAARNLFGGKAVGRLLAEERRYDSTKALQVVGVARDVRFGNPREPFGALLYVPMTQAPAPATEVAVRAVGDPARLVRAVRAALDAQAAGLPVGEVRPLADVVDSQLGNEKLLALLSTCFGLLALLLTCVGVYGVISYAVERRTQEIGIRLALGADRGSIASMLMKEVGLMMAVSVALAALFAPAAVHAMRGVLFGIAGYSLLVFPAVLLAAVAAAAGYLPARRAARLDPVDALRRE